ncbi:AAA-like domain-containing protein [Priestia megaterium]|uniref:AAA-like domain-containing protein n=1 Tax=Priestia megaterium TaxID=1404 RepID=UPI00112838A3|nr:AAA-like domain-containing protein [Priestia megaterium]TPF14220.1 ATP-binding protein [Priestia megaterium]TPF19411.1 ATP-binding protein [Priestia megaterium]
MSQTVIVNGRVVKGLKRGLNIKGNFKEKKIISKLSLYFGITFSRTEKFKNTDYNFSFLQPGDNYREKFNMYNEILLLFSPFSDFDRRALDFVDKTLGDYDNRLDKVCIFLVSKDENIELKISSLNNENKDSKLIIPFTYKEFEDNKVDKDLIENKLRKYFYSRDLFALESPIKNDTYFYGRKKMVQEFYAKYIVGEQGGLFGLRKIGKTSVLYALERTIQSKNGKSIYIDCQSPSIHGLRWFELLKEIAEKIISKYKINFDIDRYEFSEAKSAKNFEEIIVELYKLLDCNRILLILDEIEMICVDTAQSSHWKNGNDFIYFWQTIRAFCQEHQDELSFLVAGVNPHCIEKVSINGIDNPIFSMINPIYLDLFDINDVRHMVKSIGKYMGLNFDEEIYTKLVEDYGGHPFLVRHICSLINNGIPLDRPQQISKYDYEAEKNNYDFRITKYIEQIIYVLKHWYPKEYELLEILSIQGNEKFLNSLGRSDYTTIDHLMGYGILKKHRETYFITIQALKNYLENNSKQYLTETLEQKRAVISSRRNNLETILRELIKTLFIANYGKIKAREKIMAVKKTEERPKYEGIDINDLMKGHFYFLELKTLISKNWDLFKNIFENKGSFETYMDIINSLRVDAHAKDITEDEYMMFDLAMKWMEEKV